MDHPTQSSADGIRRERLWEPAPSSLPDELHFAAGRQTRKCAFLRATFYVLRSALLRQKRRDNIRIKRPM
jgi:hypothetical protein